MAIFLGLRIGVWHATFRTFLRWLTPGVTICHFLGYNFRGFDFVCSSPYFRIWFFPSQICVEVYTKKQQHITFTFVCGRSGESVATIRWCILSFVDWFTLWHLVPPSLSMRRATSQRAALLYKHKHQTHSRVPGAPQRDACIMTTPAACDATTRQRGRLELFLLTIRAYHVFYKYVTQTDEGACWLGEGSLVEDWKWLRPDP